ncbi:MAG: polar amino acid transport system permease protein [Gaiellaceae bacterium]|jgi:polar amino acid transport system permease protein|nr:polar amino acid transport system permease protein [Gaiellaceae bacterium]
MHALHNVLHAFFNLHSFTLAMPDVWGGFQVNLHMMAIAEVLVLVFALAIAVVRGLPGRGAKPLRALAIAYTDFFRGTPIIIVAFFVGFGLPGLQLGFISSQSFTTYGIIALTLVYTAYVTEVYRAGIESVHPSQRAAARSLGLSYGQTMWYVIIPQAVRRVIPPLLNDFVGLQKDTAIVGVIGIAEAAQQSQSFSTTNGDFPSYLVAAIFFILITIPLARFTDHLVARREQRERAQAF